jgi:hypothetical protein
MGHVITIAEESKVSTLSKMESYAGPEAYCDNFCSPRLTNRQLKYSFSRLQTSVLARFLMKLRRILNANYSFERWVSAFIAVICLAMVSEEQEMSICQVMVTKLIEGSMSESTAHNVARETCSNLEKQFGLIQLMFMRKRPGNNSPLHDADRGEMGDATIEDRTAVSFLRGVVCLVRENGKHIRQLGKSQSR